MENELLVAALTALSAIAGSMMGTKLINHRLDEIEKRLQSFSEMERKIIEHDFRLSRIECDKEEK